jgi:dihydrofolate reductase
MLVTLIAAVAQNGTIGRNNDLPWKIKEDMRFFVRTTRGHTVISGRKNFEAMGRPLPHRRNIVVSRNSELSFTECEVAASVPTALRLALLAEESEVFVIGGAQIYAAAMPYAHRFYRTLVLANVSGDVHFPAIDLSHWTRVELMTHSADAENEHSFVIEQWDRKDAALDLQS